MIQLNSRVAQIVAMGTLPTDDANLRLKKMTLTLVPLIIGPAAFIWGSAYFLLGHFLSGSIPMSYSILSAISLINFFRAKNTEFIQGSQMTLVLLLPFLLMWTLGGFSAGSMVMLWAVFTPIAALTYMEKRAALLWFMAYLLLILISVLIDDYVAATFAHLPGVAIKIFYLMNLGCVSAGLFLLLFSTFSEEKRTKEDELRISATAFESHESLMITDSNRVIIRVNQAFVDATGYSASEVIGKTSSILKSGRHEDEFYRSLWESVNKNGKWQGEVWDKRKNGEIYPIWLSITAVKDTSGTVTHYIGSHTDITDRKARDNELRESENRFRTYVEKGFDAIFVHDLSGRFIDVNQ